MIDNGNVRIIELLLVYLFMNGIGLVNLKVN